MATRSEKVQIVVSAKDRARGTLSNLKGQIIAIGAAYMGWRAVSGILSSITKAGIEHEKVWTEVAGALKRQGHEIDNNLKSIKRFADEMQTLTGISDEVFGKGIQLFVDYGATIDEAKDTMKVAADLAAGSGMEISAAVDLLAKAQVGYTGTLSRYGIILDESIPKNEKFAAAMEQINQKFGGAAADRMDTTAVKVGLLSQKFGDLQEELFKIGAPALLGGVEYLTDIVGGFIKMFAETDVIGDIQNQQTAMRNLSVEASNLATSYAELQSKTGLNEFEQRKLQTVTQQLAELVPTAVTAWNEYGEAVEISTEKVNAFLSAQEAALKAEFLRAVGDLKTGFEDLSQVDTKGLAEGLTETRKELDAAVEAAGPVGIGAVLASTLTHFTGIKTEIGAMAAGIQDGVQQLRDHSAELSRLVAMGSAAYPELTAGTTAYKEAVALLGQEFTDQIIAFQENAEQQLAMTTEIGETRVANAREITTTIAAFESGLVDELDEYAQYQVELQHKANQKRLRINIATMKKELAAFEATEKAKAAAAARSAQEMGAFTAQFANSAISTFGKTKREADQIWKDMAKAFMNFFIKKALAMLLPGGPFVSGLLGALKIFDVAANDRMAMQMGRDYVGYFAQGANEAMGQFTNGFAGNLSPAFNGPMLNATNGPPAGSNIYISISADVDEGSVRAKIAPILEELANNQFTNIVYDESTITGDSAVEFA